MSNLYESYINADNIFVCVWNHIGGNDDRKSISFIICWNYLQEQIHFSRILKEKIVFLVKQKTKKLFSFWQGQMSDEMNLGHVPSSFIRNDSWIWDEVLVDIEMFQVHLLEISLIMRLNELGTQSQLYFHGRNVFGTFSSLFSATWSNKSV